MITKPNHIISFSEMPLKHFLAMFDASTPVVVKEFGDTLYPASGYVDEKILGNPKTVQDLLDFDYDYAGLIVFDAKIGNLDVYYMDGNYQVVGVRKEIEKFRNNQNTFR